MISIARGSIDPKPRYSLKQDGVALNLTAAVSVRLKLALLPESAVAALDVPCTILDAAGGSVTPAWDSDDTNLPAGIYTGHLYIDWGGGQQTLYPPEGLQINIRPATLA